MLQSDMSGRLFMLLVTDSLRCGIAPLVVRGDTSFGCDQHQLFGDILPSGRLPRLKIL